MQYMNKSNCGKSVDQFLDLINFKPAKLNKLTIIQFGRSRKHYVL